MYDCTGTRHKVFTVDTQDVSGQVIGDAIQKAIRTMRVLPSLISNLSSFKIHLRESL